MGIKVILRENKLLKEVDAFPLPDEATPGQAGADIVPKREYSTSTGVSALNYLFTSIVKLLKNTVEDSETFKRLPLHVRGYIYFLAGETTPFSQQHLTPEEIDVLSKIAYDILQGNFLVSALNSNNQIDGNFILFYLEKLERFKKTGKFAFGDETTMFEGPPWTKTFYTKLLGASTTGYMAMSDEKTTINQKFLNTKMGDELVHFLGKFTLINSASGIMMYDLYDFDESKRELQTLNQKGIQYNLGFLFRGIKPLLSKITGLGDPESGGKFYNLLFKVNEFIHSSGYKGYPVRIMLPTKIDFNLLNSNIKKAETSEKLKQYYSKHVSNLPPPEQSQTKKWSADSVRQWNSLTENQKKALLKMIKYFRMERVEWGVHLYEKGEILELLDVFNDNYRTLYNPPLPEIKL